jgi:hypothetical protein
MLTCAPNGLPGPLWSWLTTSMAMVDQRLGLLVDERLAPHLARDPRAQVAKARMDAGEPGL